MDYLYDFYYVFVFDFVDFFIYVDVLEELLKSWYINCFFKFWEGVFIDLDFYFYNYVKFLKEEVVDIVILLWNEINLMNFKENIFLICECVSLIMIKSVNYLVNQVCLCK